jgi:hypothetical protein
VNGLDALKIKERLGHKHMATSERYVKAAGAYHADTVGKPFAPLPRCLLANPLARIGSDSQSFPNVTGSDCRTRTYDPAVNSRLLYQLS